MTKSKEPHPEHLQCEVAPLTHFKVDLSRAASASSNIDREISEAEQWIDAFQHRIKLDHTHWPVLSFLLEHIHSQRDLEILGRALLKIAPRVGQMQTAKSKKSFLELASSDPTFIAATIGDFEDVTSSINLSNLDEDGYEQD